MPCFRIFASLHSGENSNGHFILPSSIYNILFKDLEKYYHLIGNLT